MRLLLTAKEAAFVSAILESFTNEQERKEDERVRQSLWAKMREIARLDRERRATR